MERDCFARWLRANIQAQQTELVQLHRLAVIESSSLLRLCETGESMSASASKFHLAWVAKISNLEQAWAVCCRMRAGCVVARNPVPFTTFCGTASWPVTSVLLSCQVRWYSTSEKTFTNYWQAGSRHIVIKSSVDNAKLELHPKMSQAGPSTFTC